MSKDLHCAYFKSHRCRSCSLLAHQPSERNALKLKKFISTLQCVIEENTIIEEFFQADTFFPSRAKAKLSVSGDIDHPIIGLLDKTFQGIELLNCPLHMVVINDLLMDLPNIICNYKLQPYNISAKTGELKGVIINSNSDSSEMMLRFILRSTEAVARIRKAIPALQQKHSSLKVVSANIQPTPHQIPEGKEEHILTAAQYIWEKYGDIYSCLRPQCFSQVTPVVATALYRYVQKIIETSKPKRVLDVFCGVGGFTLFAAKFAKEVIGIEYSPAAIESAKISASRNEINNAQFYASDAEEFLLSYDQSSPCTIICNPPRRGLSTKIIESIKRLNPQEFIYSSCNPETLARDILAMKDKYQLLSLAPFDMFPLTEHLEVVARLGNRRGLVKT